MNPEINVSNNRLETGEDYTFDSSGNTIGNPDDQTFVYDGENKQVKALDEENETIGEYWYDGDGRRVKKYVRGTGEVTVFVYDAAGKQIAEYSTVAANSTDAKVAYLTSDNLGSLRIDTDKTVTSPQDTTITHSAKRSRPPTATETSIMWTIQSEISSLRTSGMVKRV